MPKLFVVLITSICLGGLIFYQYQNKDGSNTLANSAQHVQDSTLTKCVTKDGQVFYGDIPNNIVCNKLETVPELINVIETSNQPIEIDKPTIKLKESSSKINLSRSRKNHSNTKFKCDGRQHCSQVRSCAEARFVLQNCPNTKMDGDGDGIPCEDQWCKN